MTAQLTSAIKFNFAFNTNAHLQSRMPTKKTRNPAKRWYVEALVAAKRVEPEDEEGKRKAATGDESYLIRRFDVKQPSWKYLVKWAGFPESENTWEPTATFNGAGFDGMLQRFWDSVDGGEAAYMVNIPGFIVLPSTEFIAQEKFRFAQRTPQVEIEAQNDDPFREPEEHISLLRRMSIPNLATATYPLPARISDARPKTAKRRITEFAPSVEVSEIVGVHVGDKAEGVRAYGVRNTAQFNTVYTVPTKHHGPGSSSSEGNATDRSRSRSRLRADSPSPRKHGRNRSRSTSKARIFMPYELEDDTPAPVLAPVPIRPNPEPVPEATSVVKRPRGRPKKRVTADEASYLPSSASTRGSTTSQRRTKKARVSVPARNGNVGMLCEDASMANLASSSTGPALVPNYTAATPFFATFDMDVDSSFEPDTAIAEREPGPIGTLGLRLGGDASLFLPFSREGSTFQ
ncbi:Chromo domain-containing protein [Mycena kentingensis (nom. inval.)]|nr:Chromo domain-containing protein [Mycena kentingensis (nom. inval.)]